ncbi:Glycerol-3-phosphate transporter [Reticulomyxa filosa]|uniref:Glycerol-3-phosphate transporter n=1 Tax=Reticulomyxa filosa TaxID=46433 RepID=X6NUS3_RETFI|nr:Glycerol-3-phosphate transporter [Reticulomyxa filosa]|eukprot:ETO29012.1 Glycerol-3-phosphate transporter [Reticulomyxa filosa]
MDVLAPCHQHYYNWSACVPGGPRKTGNASDYPLLQQSSNTNGLAHDINDPLQVANSLVPAPNEDDNPDNGVASPLHNNVYKYIFYICIQLFWDILIYRAVNAQSNNDEKNRKHISLWEAMRIPNVMMYATCYACLKSVNYAMFFWLPFFLGNSFGNSMANLLTMLYNVGQIFGSWICGWMSDYIHKRSPPVFLFLVLAIAPVLMLRADTSSELYFGVVVTAGGFLIGGPANMISGAISADLGKEQSVKGNAEALSTVAGIIDGTASFGAAIMQYLVAVVSDAGWDYVFIMLSLSLVGSTLLVTPLFLREMKELCRHGIQHDNTH